MNQQSEVQIQRAALSPEEFAISLGRSRWWVYTRKGDFAPKAVVVGGRRMITEDPASYLARIAAIQRAA